MTDQTRSATKYYKRCRKDTESCRATRTRCRRERQTSLFSGALLRVEPPPETHEHIDQRRHEDDREDHFGQHLAKDQLADREDPVEGDGDEDERVDDLAEDAGDGRTRPQQTPAGLLQPDENGDVEQGRDAIGED